MPPANPAWPTDGTATLVPTTDEDGEPVFVLLAKRTYDLTTGAGPVPAGPPAPLQLIDVYYDDGDPQTHTVRVENETAPYKLKTDVVVVGSAWAPKLAPTRQFDATVEVAGARKTIRVIGDRSCEFRTVGSPRFTDPVPFVEMPVRYERAYGGTDEQSVPEFLFMYPRNPRGAGLAFKNVKERIDRLPLPNLEDPADLLTPDRVVVGEPENWPRQPLPQGFGWFPKIAYPRCSFVGAMPAFLNPGVPLKEEELGLVPRDHVRLARRLRLPPYDVRFNSGASPGLALPFLSGGEPVRLTNLSADGPVSFLVPRDRPRMALDFGRGRKELPPVLHTLQVRVEERQLDVIWRGSVRHPGLDWLPELTRLVAEVTWP
jgi:hypothetical protein